VHYTTSCKQSQVLLRMSEIIARNLLSWLELLINLYCCIWLVVYIILSVMHGQTISKFKSAWFALGSQLTETTSDISHLYRENESYTTHTLLELLQTLSQSTWKERWLERRNFQELYL